jgi:hypothetical protein
MKNPEDILYEKLNKLFLLLVSKVVKPDKEIDSILSLDIESQKELIKLGIKGLILDVDETLRYNMESIPEENKKWLEEIKKYLKIIIISNGYDKEVEEYLNSINITYLNKRLKPLKSSFKKACTELNLSPREIAVIGDDIFSDIHGGNRCNMYTIKVKEKIKK